MTSPLLRTKSSAGDSEASTSIHNNILRVQTNADVFKKYEVIQVFAPGSMGTVSKVRIKEDMIGGSAFRTKPKGIVDKLKKKLTGKKDEPRRKPSSISQEHVYALKSIILDRVDPIYVEELKNEISILRTLDHPNIVKAHEVFICKKKIYIVLELCDGGDLFTRAPYTEKAAARIVAQLLSAVTYLHEMGIVHRDIKYENIMFEDTSDTAEIKLIDFGLSKKFMGKPGTMTERVGTIYTMAPQVLQGVYSSQADIWSVGVVTYMLLSSTKPFYSRTRRQMIDLIMRGHYSFDAAIWKNISGEAKDFVSKLLVVDPNKRLNGPDALKHPWIVNREQLPDDLPSADVLAAIDNSLISYRDTSQLKKLALTVIAHRSTSKEILHLRKVFDSFDTEKDGVLSHEEFKAALEKMNYSGDVIEEIFSSIDLNRNGKINYTEFLAATIEAYGRIEEDRIAEAFDRLDSDGVGYISRQNLREALGKDRPPEEVEAIMAASDKDKDGKISYAEFLESFREQTRANVQMLDAEASAAGSNYTGRESLVGLDAKIPGGRFDSDLSPSLKKQLEA